MPDASPPTDPTRRRLVTWLWRLPVIAAFGTAAWGVYEAARVHFGKEPPNPNPRFSTQEPIRVAALSDLAAPWSGATFTIDNRPGIALRLPDAVPGGLTVAGTHYAAFSLVCTHLGCIAQLNRNPEAIALAFNYRSDTPALVCRCHLSVFLPSRAGEAVSGPAVAPLPRVRLEARGGDLYATGVELSES